jgi:TM2 domain-containing membrane protein YozV
MRRRIYLEIIKMIKITKREILFSIIIFTIVMLIGLLISSKISDYQLDKNEEYNKALKINSTELFSYGMRTDVGNAFVYGTLKAIDTVTYPEIDGNYMYVEKVKERYTEHFRTVYHTVGKTSYSTVEPYWTWDVVGREHLQCKELSFLGIIFDSSKFIIPDASYITTKKESFNIRYKYYGDATEYTGTIYTELKDNTISNETIFYNNQNIEKVVKDLESNFGTIIFWVVWIAATSIGIYFFYSLDNDWLEDKIKRRK